jgi:ADP-ribose pyrophosphatase YjhB (NUDIX family)
VPTPDRYVGVIASHQERIVLVLERHDADGELWSMPGGHVEAGEAPAEGAAREAIVAYLDGSRPAGVHWSYG